MMKTYSVTIHMNNGDRLNLNDCCFENETKLLDTLLFNENSNTPDSNRFAIAYQGDHRVCYCVRQVSSIHYKEVE